MLTGAPVFGLIFDFPSTNGSVIIHFASKAKLCLTVTTINYENNMSSYVNAMTPITDQGIISPCNADTISSRQVRRISIGGLLVELISNSPN